MAKEKINKGREKNGQFSKGNTFGVGRNPIFAYADELKEACDKYFEWADNNPWIKNDVVRGGDNAGMLLQTPTQRPYTLIAMCHHIGIDVKTWYEYEKLDGFTQICTYMREKIDNQQLEGAMIGAFNASITARRLGLSDKKVLEGGDPNKPIQTNITTKVIFEDYTEKKKDD